MLRGAPAARAHDTRSRIEQPGNAFDHLFGGLPVDRLEVLEDGQPGVGLYHRDEIAGRAVEAHDLPRPDHVDAAPAVQAHDGDAALLSKGGGLLRSDSHHGAEEIIGQPRAIFDKSGPRTERLGGLYNLNYQIQLIGPNQEFTIYLHAIVKSILTLARIFLEGQGIINMQLGATDFVPRAEYQPEHAYMRALNVDFQYPFDIFKEMGDLATAFTIQLEQGGEPCETILSESEC